LRESPIHIDLIIPVYNEEEVVQLFHQRLCEVIDRLAYGFTVIYIDDGSSDATFQRLQAISESDPRVIAIELSRNFGHQAALTAGLDHARGDYVITMDGDGEHPPELIPQMIELALAGYDIVLTQRAEAQRASFFKQVTSTGFYWLLNRLGNTRILPGSADFRLINRAALDALGQMREYQRFLRGMVSWMGYKSVILPYVPAARLGGRSKYSLRLMLRLAANAIFSFSLVPLYVSISLGGLFLFLALVEMIYVLSFWVTGQQSTLAPGWSSLMFVLLVVGGSLMVTLGIIGIYVGYIYQEVKGRPIYLIRRILGGQQPTQNDV
jgi:polyisoprenyl-phosphate glycosyltransferase